MNLLESLGLDKVEAAGARKFLTLEQHTDLYRAAGLPTDDLPALYAQPDRRAEEYKQRRVTGVIEDIKNRGGTIHVDGLGYFYRLPNSETKHYFRRTN